MEGNTLEACGTQGETCMRCGDGRTCSAGICLGGNPNTALGNNNNGDDNKGPLPSSSALWWMADDLTLHRFLPEPSQQTQFPFSSPVAFWDVSQQGKRWAVMLTTSATQYEVLQAFDNTLHSLQTGNGVPQKISFAKDSQGLAFLVANENNQGQLFWSIHPNDSPQQLSFEKCGFQNNSVNVLDFAWSPDSARLAVLARIADDVRAGIWLLTTTQPGTCTTVVHPQEAEGATSSWGAFAPLLWRDNNTLLFRAHLTYAYPLQLYSFGLSGMGGIASPILSGNSHSLLSFALMPSASLLALLQENLALSFLSLSPFATLLPASGCETESFETTQAMLFSPGEDWLAVVGNARSLLIRLEDMSCRQTSTPAVFEAVWSPNGKFFAELSWMENSATWVVVLHQNNGKTLLNPNVVSSSPVYLHQLRWTSY